MEGPADLGLGEALRLNLGLGEVKVHLHGRAEGKLLGRAQNIIHRVVIEIPIQKRRRIARIEELERALQSELNTGIALSVNSIAGAFHRRTSICYQQSTRVRERMADRGIFSPIHFFRSDIFEFNVVSLTKSHAYAHPLLNRLSRAAVLPIRKTCPVSAIIYWRRGRSFTSWGL